MYVQLSGNVSPCWKTVGQCDTWSKERSLIDIWNGEEFQKYRNIGLRKGFLEVVSGPMVRSSYRAERALQKNNAGL